MMNDDLLSLSYEHLLFSDNPLQPSYLLCTPVPATRWGTHKQRKPSYIIHNHLWFPLYFSLTVIQQSSSAYLSNFHTKLISFCLRPQFWSS